MNRFLIFLLTINTLGGVAFANTAQEPTQLEVNIIDPQVTAGWCRDVAALLKRAFDMGSHAKTYAEEKVILSDGIKNALQQSNEKYTPFLRYTLKAALDDLDIFEQDLQRQVNHLRTGIRNGLSDLRYIEAYVNNKADQRIYVREILYRTLLTGVQLPFDTQELVVLTRTAQRSIILLNMSDGRRYENVVCAKRDLELALKSADATTDIKTKNEYLRVGIRAAYDRLYRNRYCH